MKVLAEWKTGQIKNRWQSGPSLFLFVETFLSQYFYGRLFKD